ncbi:MAG TPA: restriction endonuclease subunit S [Candidatus Deferrimicrobium sp.]|nr:restriction endonuclease subunit S [Candidatus Deferrimicrobium sp.]
MEWKETEFGRIPHDWKVTKLSNLCIEKGGIQTGPFGSQLHQKDYVLNGHPIITVEHLGENRILHINLPNVSSAYKVRLTKYILKENDIVFSRVGSVDRRALVRKNEEGWLFSGRCLRVRVKNELINPIFLSWYFGLPAFKDYIRRIAVGATMPSLNTQLLRNVPIIVPPLSEQRAIAHILGSLDDMIELNRQMNETLEAMARVLFKSWFVDFDPVRARAEGRDPGLPPDIANLFPDSFEDSELGLIPKGWKVKNIGDMTRCVGGATPDTKNSNYWEGGKIHFATPKDMSSLKSPILFNTDRCITDDGVNKIGSRILPKGTVLLSSRAPIGYLAITEIPVSINQGIIAMICDKGIPNYYVVFWAKANMDKIIGNANGTTFQEISKQNFRPMKILIPSPGILEMFTLQLEPIYSNLAINLKESQFLSNIRDTLLPKLISGEIRVPDAEKFIKKNLE